MAGDVRGGAEEGFDDAVDVSGEDERAGDV